MKKMTLRTLLLGTLLAAAPIRAQLESPLLSKLQLNLVNPGGKSLAMGGAFVSLADDATAALANPAGVAILNSWQAGASGKGFRFEPRLTTDNFSGDSSGHYTLLPQDEYRPSGTTNELEFASIVGPLLQDVSIALYRAVNLRYSLDASDLAGGNYRSFFANVGSNSSISLDEQGGLDLRNEIYGVSIGAQFGPLALGAGVTFNKLKFDLTGGAAGGAHLFIANADNMARTDVADRRIDAAVTSSVESGTRVGWLVGTKIQLEQAHDVSFGAVYRKSPRFDMAYSVNATFPATPGQRVSFSCGVDDPNIPNSGASACGTFRVPDDFSVGLSGRIAQRFLIAVEVQRIKYSELNDGFVPLFVYCASRMSPCPATDRAVAQGSTDDGTLPRVGVEYTIPFQAGSEVNVRAGYFREPAHGMRLALYPDADRDRRADPGSAPLEVTNPPISQAYRTSFDGGQAENHVSFGLGATIARHLSVDFAGDIAKTTKSFVLSAFYRF